MSDPLVTYVNDHLGGARIALQLLEAMRDQHDDQNFRDLASVLLPAVRDDDHVLRAIAERIGPGPSPIKEVGGWILEKAGRLKLGHTGSTDFAMFESLELLVLGIHGKLCLWKALLVVSRTDSRLEGFDFEALSCRAQHQYDRVERNRLHLAQTVFLKTES
jgi:hypothetical protein